MEKLKIEPLTIAETPVIILTFFGEFAGPEMDEAAASIEQVFQSTPKPHNLILDLSNVGYMGSRAMGYLIQWQTNATTNGGRLILCAAQENVDSLLHSLGIKKMILYFDTLEKAKAVFLKPAL